MNVRWHVPCLYLVSALVYFTCLGSTTFWDEDETIYGTIVHEMRERGDVIVPTFNARPATDKPPLFYWLCMASCQALGENEFAMRLVSALCALATTLLMYDLGKRLYNARASFWGALALLGSLNWALSARAATIDALLVLLCALTMYVFYRAGGLTQAAISWRASALMYGVMGVATLAKGPVGFVLPTLALMILKLWQRAADDNAAPRNWRARIVALLKAVSPARVWSVGWALRPLTAIGMIVLVAGPWFVLVGIATDGAWLRGFFGEHNFQRFVSPNYNHSGSVFYHLIGVMVGMFPWSILLPLALVRQAGRVARRDVARGADMFLLSWAAAYVVFFSLSSTKLPNYVLPAYLPLALTIGVLVDRWLGQAAEVDLAWKRFGMHALAIGGAVFCVVLLGVAQVVMKTDYQIALVGLIPVAGGLIAFELCTRKYQQAGLAVFAVASTLFIIVAFTFVAQTVNRHHTGPQLARDWRAAAGPEAKLVAFRHLDSSHVYYAGSQIPEYFTVPEIVQYLAEHPGAYVLTKEEEADAIAVALPEGMRVVDRRRRFLRPGELVLFGPEKDTSVRAATASTARR
ncbi:MAG: glycosyltransferase family 39 protein [Planctomycetes bacterium]|nr:glycosyltransferase family 39 protein [Planctomycetota bacterium]